MRVPTIALVAAAALLIASVSHAALPGTPQVTVGADIKQLIFDWDDVSGAAYYRLMYKVGSGDYKPLRDNIPASTTQLTLSIAVHLYYWSKLRYAVAACNASGCTRSADISPQNLMLDSIGYFKASNTDTDPNHFYDIFGHSLVLSDDGRTLAVAAPSEDSKAAGVNGNQADNSSIWSGAVYVFRRVTTGWRQEAYLKAGVNQPWQAFGTNWASPSPALAINADGSLLAVGAPRQEVSGMSEAGAVYIYQKSSTGRWSLATTLSSPTPGAFVNFGTSLDMSLDGRTLKVDQVSPWDGPAPDPQVRMHIFVRPDATWQHSVTLAPFFAGDVCRIVRLSGDGKTLVSACIDSTGATRLETRKRSGNTWTHVSEQPLRSEISHIGLVLNFDASTLAMQELPDSAPRVGLYQWTGATWAMEREFFPLVSSYYGGLFGAALGLNRTGNLLAIGNPGETENGAGVSPVSMPGTEVNGAVNLWRRDDRNGTWTLRSVIKSPNPGVYDRFGSSLAMCGTGNALAVGAIAEDSKAKGVDGDRTDNSSTDSGAVYLY